MRPLSKSKLMAYRQCPRRLWLEVQRPELRQDSAATEASFTAGHQVGNIARRLYAPESTGHLIDLDALGFPAVFEVTAGHLTENRPIFEASFQADGALALADVLLPLAETHPPAWRMVEVKSSTSVKNVHRDDVAIQAHVARAAGVNLAGVAVAHIDSGWVYLGSDDYRGLLKEIDLTAEVFARSAEVRGWIEAAQEILAQDAEPAIHTSPHCNSPYPCGFHNYCASFEPLAQMPIKWLPRFACQSWIEQGIRDLREVPPECLNPVQQRVRECTIHNEVYFDQAGAAADLSPHPLPGRFLDFETIQFAVPLWAGTRPYQQIPFQFSLHHLAADGMLGHEAFLDLSGSDPSRPFSEKLVAVCGSSGPVFVYNAAFEKTRIAELAERFPYLAEALHAINARIVDLLPIARNRFYHPSQQGSWSIKAVLPAAVPELSYDALDGVQNGGDAQEAFLEALHPSTFAARKAELERQLLDYCHLDTYAMVRLWQVFAGRSDWRM